VLKVAREPSKLEETGSIPAARFGAFYCEDAFDIGDSAEPLSRTPRGVAQSGSAFGWGPKGRWFKSSRPD
jgi:hypothetical protein